MLTIAQPVQVFILAVGVRHYTTWSLLANFNGYAISSNDVALV